MAFESIFTYEFSKHGETKPVQQDFVKKTFRVSVSPAKSKTSDVYRVEWTIIRDAKYDQQKVLVEEESSVWDLFTTKLVHRGTGKIWDPDIMFRDHCFRSVIAIYEGDMQMDVACSFLQDLFDQTEVDLLGEDESIFATHFPKYFKYRYDVLRKKREKLIAKTMKS